MEKINLKKEIISFYETSDDAYKAEELLITEEMILSNEYYNLVPGGKGFGNGCYHPMFNKITVKNEINEILVISKEEYYNNKDKYNTINYNMKRALDSDGNNVFILKEEFESGNYTNRPGRPLSESAKDKLKQNSYFKGHVIIKTADDKYNRVTTEEYKTGKYTCASHGKVFSEESRKKISDAKIGTHHNDETKLKISKALKGKYTGENSPTYGLRGPETGMYRKHTVIDETGEYKVMSIDDPEYKNYKSMTAGENSPMYKKVVVVDKDGNRMIVSTDDPRYVSKELIHVNSGNFHTDETRKKVSETLSGRKLTQDHKEKVCKNLDQSKKASINGIIYPKLKIAYEECKKLYGLSSRKVKERLLSDEYPEWFIINKRV